MIEKIENRWDYGSVSESVRKVYGNLPESLVFLLLLIVLIFFVHALVMSLGLAADNSMSISKILIDSFILVLIIYPGIYFVFLNNLVKENRNNKNLVTALLPSKELFDNLMDEMNEGLVIINRSNEILFVNNKMLELLGYSKLELNRKSFTDLLKDESKELFRKYIDRNDKFFQERFEVQLIKSDRDYNWVLISQSNLVDEKRNMNGCLMVITNIEEMKQTQQVLLNSEIQLRSIVNSMPSILLFVDLYGVIVSANLFAVEYFYSLGIDQIIGKSIEDYIDSNFYFEYEEHFATTLRESISTIEYPVSLFGKKRYFREISVPYFHMHNGISGCISVISDISSQCEKEQKLTIAKEKAEKSDKLTSEFLSKLSDEVRTPLNIIVNSANLLIEECNNFTPQVKEYHDFINQEVSKLIMTFEMMLELSEMVNENYKVTFKRIELVSKILIRVLKKVETISKNKNIVINIENNAVTTFVTGDEHSLFQIFYHIIHNAVKFSKHSKVEIALMSDVDKLIVHIRDSGIGISENYMTKMFEPFTQEDDSNTRKYLGLGLALVKHHCDLNHIKIAIRSKKDVGSTIVLEIPI